ncbi:MAG: 4-hydroxythreonine-4-phosphate dehydrogenase PdxA [Elusimicrobiota bacterium]|nr:4-hydroxythreonine-4-phosphate dehydrogenase PdxA [Elusimicrobiota bacterium]
MNSHIPPVVLITMGDPAGIGPEIIVKSFIQEPSLFEILTPIVIGDFKIIKKYSKKQLSLLQVGKSLFEKNTKQYFELLFRSLSETRQKSIIVIDLDNVNLKSFEFGKIQPSSGKSSIEYINYAIKTEKIFNYKFPLVTAPVSKTAIIKSGINFKGHTEYLAKLTKTKEVAMLMVSGEVSGGNKYKVLLLTRHIPLKDVSRKLSIDYIVKQVNIAVNSIKKYFVLKNLHILMCTFNPHGGEDGKVGHEEKNVIIPAIEKLRKQSLNVTDPLPADIAFQSLTPTTKTSFGYHEPSTLIVCNYHDQGMLPMKLLCKRKFVNLTCGLPFVRTSPAHGPAFDIAGKGGKAGGFADPTSMIEALKLAAKLVSRICH